MSLFLIFVFIFYCGSSIGWIIELFFRRIVHGKWVNPGFLVGPYLPIYGLGLAIMTSIHVLLDNYDFHPIVAILLMGLCMTLLELVGGLIFLKAGVRLWDYRDRKFNYKGVICPTFTVIWTLVGALYYFFLATPVLNALEWFSNNLSFSYILGIFTGCIVIDFCYSSKLYLKIRKYAKNNNIDVMYEKLKLHIKEKQEERKEKYSFLLPFYQTKNLIEYLMGYDEKAFTESLKEKKKKRKKKKNGKQETNDKGNN